MHDVCIPSNKAKMVQYLNYMSVCKIAAKPASDAQVEWSKESVDVFASNVSSVQTWLCNVKILCLGQVYLPVFQRPFLPNEVPSLFIKWGGV